MIRRIVTIIGIAVVALSILAACSGNNDSSGSSSSNPPEPKFTQGEAEEHFLNWLCPEQPWMARFHLQSVQSLGTPMPWRAETRAYTPAGAIVRAFEMSEHDKEWVGVDRASQDYGTTMRGSYQCKP